MLEAYREHVKERAEQGIVPQPISTDQMSALVDLLKNPPPGEEAFLLDLLSNRVPAGVDQAAYVKAGFLTAIAKGETTSPIVSKETAVELLGQSGPFLPPGSVLVSLETRRWPYFLF